MASIFRLDRRSGQTYFETEMTPIHPHGPAWVHETPYLPEGWESTSRVGAPTLKHSAMIQTLSNQRNLVPGLFVNVPWPIASYLWDCLGRSRKRTLYMWKVFATAYPEEFARVAHYRSMKIGGLRLSLRDYLGMAKSETLKWRAVLTLGSLFATIPELVEISDVRNLVALEVATQTQVGAIRLADGPDADIEETQGTALNDRIVRTWSERARTTGALAHLRVLRVYYQADLSRAALRYLAQLPALRFIVAYECSGLLGCMREGEVVDGWEKSSFEPFLSKDLYSSYQASLSGDVDSEPSTVGPNCPVLDFQLGGRMDALPLTSARGRAKMLCLRRTRAEAGPATKRLKVTRPVEAGPRKPVMKDRRAKDLSDVLGNFLGGM
ncbi:uncharacterized protein KD926_007077 [Aspergillus affinis]|uniref:uncharacterized protein n=1 Tax=Aspergillus affinis TaxID=1070780 RepID=UPI0022FE8BCE|nr:uncharacterized protein KD926_007077 [Aspergillus affinis]KAI9045774.1 hypothetical protein KD926_007077 [Aspergillus affinis]